MVDQSLLGQSVEFSGFGGSLNVAIKSNCVERIEPRPEGGQIARRQLGNRACNFVDISHGDKISLLAVKGNGREPYLCSQSPNCFFTLGTSFFTPWPRGASWSVKARPPPVIEIVVLPMPSLATSW